MEQQVIIYADVREKASGVLPRLQELGAQVKVGELEIGDYVVSGSLVIERKTAAEFVDSVMDGRLFNQTGKMKLNFERSIFLIDGDVYSTRNSIAREAIDGALSFLVGMEGISVLYVRNPVATADLIYRMAKHAQQDGKETAFRRGKVQTGRQESLFCIEGVVGVGPATAVKILEHFGSTHAFMNATIEELKSVSGIGAKKAERIFGSIRWQVDSVAPGEAQPSMFVDA